MGAASTTAGSPSAPSLTELLVAACGPLPEQDIVLSWTTAEHACSASPPSVTAAASPEVGHDETPDRHRDDRPKAPRPKAPRPKAPRPNGVAATTHHTARRNRRGDPAARPTHRSRAGHPALGASAGKPASAAPAAGSSPSHPSR